VALHAQPLQARGEGRADQLEQQVQVGIPALAGLRGTQREEAAGAAVQRERAGEQRADAEFGEARGIGGRIAARADVSRISTMRRCSRPCASSGQSLERVALHHLRVEGREQRGGARHALDGLAVVVEQRDADRVDAPPPRAAPRGCA